MGGGPTSPCEHELKSVLTPDLLSFLVSLRLPYAIDARINFSNLGHDIFLVDTVGGPSESRVLPVLIALSKIGLDRMPDLTTYLPPPADPSYPEQSLGLQLLLDQYTRVLLQGIDRCWTVGCFDKLSRRLAATWLALPPDQRPDSWRRWQAAGAGLDYWLGTRLWFGGPWVHSESRSNQDIALAFTDETRRAIEATSGQVDPNRARREEILSDVVGLPREYRKGPPQGGDVTREMFAWWITMLMDIHKPIIDKFGRYPQVEELCKQEAGDGKKGVAADFERGAVDEFEKDAVDEYEKEVADEC
ncbi:hypothetical protein B0H66DRAFT_643444 [Apodospora peruviana]|uniref:Uncharacterized protein n=1 Tax=Apodospora peruviana TaxID=516989 RepID=A0AAE0LZY4_9PEZI|nr:hypothetical protein B0H66DRAFT_643444 [Apodospora peruviana]